MLLQDCWLPHHEMSHHFRNLLPASTGSETHDSVEEWFEQGWVILYCCWKPCWKRGGMKIRQCQGRAGASNPITGMTEAVFNNLPTNLLLWAVAGLPQNEGQRTVDIERRDIWPWTEEKGQCSHWDTEADITGYPEGYCPFNLTLVLLFCISVV